MLPAGVPAGGMKYGTGKRASVFFRAAGKPAFILMQVHFERTVNDDQEKKMSGIVLYKTGILMEVKRFYVRQTGSDVWHQQEDCIILRHGNFLFGFCAGSPAETGGTLAFFYDTAADVDRLYMKLAEIAVSPPVMNGNRSVYSFCARDPEGRNVEFRCFTRLAGGFRAGDELLMTRRSVRSFQQKEIPAEILDRVFEISRYAPTSRNTQSYYFKLIRERTTLDWLSRTRGGNSAPIGRAPAAAAICADPGRSKRHVQDGCIAAYHFILAAWHYGLGTCWIAAMDRDDVKERLNIPQHHYVATITPLGYPEGALPEAPPRRDRDWFIRE